MAIKAGSYMGGMEVGNGLGTSEAIAASAHCSELPSCRSRTALSVGELRSLPCKLSQMVVVLELGDPLLL